MKKFCVIAVDYENHVPRTNSVPSIQKGLESLSNQTFKDFNLIICHDGPKMRSYEDEGIDFKAMGLDPVIINTPHKMSNWGHSSRDFAMRYAYEHEMGEYYIQFNIDNQFVPNAFDIINNKIEETKSGIIIFTVRHYKAVGGNPFMGIPPVHCNIDCMQLVASKDIWADTNFWYRTEGTSDGLIYEEMCKKHSWVHIIDCLGDNY